MFYDTSATVLCTTPGGCKIVRKTLSPYARVLVPGIWRAGAVSARPDPGAPRRRPGRRPQTRPDRRPTPRLDGENICNNLFYRDNQRQAQGAPRKPPSKRRSRQRYPRRLTTRCHGHSVRLSGADSCRPCSAPGAHDVRSSRGTTRSSAWRERSRTSRYGSRIRRYALCAWKPHWRWHWAGQGGKPVSRGGHDSRTGTRLSTPQVSGWSPTCLLFFGEIGHSHAGVEIGDDRLVHALRPQGVFHFDVRLVLHVDDQRL